MWKISTSKKKLDLGNYHKKPCTDYIFVYLVFFIPTYNQFIVMIFIALVFRRCSLNRAWIMSPSKWWDWFHLISAVLHCTEPYVIYDLWSVSAWSFPLNLSMMVFMSSHHFIAVTRNVIAKHNANAKKNDSCVQRNTNNIFTNRLWSFSQ